MGKLEEVSAAIEFAVWGITEMGEAESQEKAWFVGRSGGRGETSNYGDGFYGYGDDGKSTSCCPTRIVTTPP